MVLGMARPWLHPKTGVYYFRKGVPAGMRELVGRWEVKISLGTRDPALARILHARIAATVDEDWARLLSAPTSDVGLPQVTLSHKAMAALAGELYEETVKAHEENPGSSSIWHDKLMAVQQALPLREREAGVPNLWGGRSWSFAPAQVAIHYVGPEMRAFLAKKGIALTPLAQRKFALLVASALAQAYRLLERHAMGDYSPDVRKERFPKLQSGATWQELYESYRAERLPDPSTVKRQKSVLSKFFAFVGHDIPAAVTEEQAIAWKEKRLKEVAPQTVRDADVAHPRTFFRWAKGEKKIAGNPFAEVTVSFSKKKVPQGSSGKMREYNPDEARRVLRASLLPPPPRMTIEGAAARRWVPWLCAYSGARVNEITQARAADVHQSPSYDGTEMIWVIKITPEAGTVKDDEEREVALHPHLVEQGFLEYVKSRKGKHLFYDPARSRSGSPANPQYAKVGQRLAAWVREDVGITDKRIAPNHAWRHLFRSQLLKAGVQEQVINGIDGHAPQTVGQQYGRVWPEVSLDAVSRIPPYRFEEDRQ